MLVLLQQARPSRAANHSGPLPESVGFQKQGWGKKSFFTLNRLANKLNPTNTRLYINKSKAFSGEIIDDKNLKTASKLKKFLVQGTQYLS